jgi:hypothetical protein
VERECACACARGVCLFGSVCVSVYVCVWCSDLSRNKFTKITVEAAPLLVTLYHPNLQDAHGLVYQSDVHARMRPATCASYVPSVDLQRYLEGLDRERHPRYPLHAR